ncbi:substrate-binding domain-containing protein [Victivallis sp. Marseille-Q1083]|uniref:GntR family transcriptional regulator n=1 Tax=Victivallis sp. Marseille-Q1083 TaxID=2717288 RepID=UPI00158E6F76|nr:GntR family transcriptional regulator [Victivallis sp. Marseille-Q1083]
MVIDKKNPRPLYLQLKSLLEEKIVSGQFKAHQALPSERELCRNYHVSQITVRQALKELENLGLVLRVPGKGTFAAEHLRLEHDKARQMIGLITGTSDSDLENSYWMQLVGGIKIVLHHQQTGFMLFLESETSFRELAAQGALQGLIVSNPSLNFAIFQELEEHHVPVVVIGRPESRNRYSVDSDNVAVGYLLTRHLLDSGYRKIGFLGFDPGFPVVADRVAGYKSALHEAGIPAKRAWQVFADYSPALGREQAEELYSAGVDAVVCVDDLIAMNVLKRLGELGVAVPQEIGVAGCNNSILARFAHPALTSMELFPEQLGVLAAQKLLALMQQQPTERRTVVDVQLQIRASSVRAPA